MFQEIYLNHDLSTNAFPRRVARRHAEQQHLRRRAAYVGGPKQQAC